MKKSEILRDLENIRKYLYTVYRNDDYDNWKGGKQTLHALRVLDDVLSTIEEEKRMEEEIDIGIERLAQAETMDAVQDEIQAASKKTKTPKLTVQLNYMVDGDIDVENGIKSMTFDASTMHIKDLLAKFEEFATKVLEYQITEDQRICVVNMDGSIQWKASQR